MGKVKDLYDVRVVAKKKKNNYEKVVVLSSQFVLRALPGQANYHGKNTRSLVFLS